MDFLTVYAIYMTVAMLVVGLWASRVPHEDVKMVFILSLIWPISILAILVMASMAFTGWNLDVAKGSKMFGFRKPTNTSVTGFAITVLFGEVQFWKSCAKEAK